MSETKIKTKKKVNKMAIAVVTLSLALIAAIGGIFGVYAALQQNVSTTFTVQYSIGKNVAVGLNAMAICGNDDPVWLESDPNIYDANNDKGPIYKVSANDQNRNLQFVLPEEYDGVLSLTATDNGYGITCECFMQFYIQNLSDKTIKVTVTDKGIKTDNITTVYQSGKVEEVGQDDYYTSVPAINVMTFNIPAGELYMFRLVIYGNQSFDGNTSASYTSTAENGISFVFEQA